MRLFPFDEVRQGQDVMLSEIATVLRDDGQIVIHAPTGLGKTAAALAPAIERALEEEKTVIFTTSRLTQHALALQTVEQIGKKHGVRIPVIDLIGKRHLCLQKGVEGLGSKEFADYCASMREDGVCEYYTNLKDGEQPSAATRAALIQIGKRDAIAPEQVREAAQEQRVCPYEVLMLAAAKARVIIADYTYLFHPRIREGFLRRINKGLHECIIIVDEGHNLAERVKDMASERITNTSLRRALRELEKHQPDTMHHVREIAEQLERIALATPEERTLSREEFTAIVERSAPIGTLADTLHEVGKRIQEEEKSSSCASLASFLLAWQDEDESHVRILRVTKEKGELRGWQLTYRCLDPRGITQQVFESASGSILMSGTLTPPEMYASVLGLARAQTLSLPSPFPPENRLSVIIPKTTTRFTARSAEMFGQIAQICNEIVENVPGNCAIFTPSYAILDRVRNEIETGTAKSVFVEHPQLTREEREELLRKFRASALRGAVLIGVMGGSFAEGVDLPGNDLRCVIVVGLPLARPDIETKALIAQYDRVFGKGWDWGYTLPALNRILQTAGRCIRTHTDRGAIIFLDERYAWEQYARHLPREWRTTISLRYGELLREFFAGDAHG